MFTKFSQLFSGLWVCLRSGCAGGGGLFSGFNFYLIGVGLRHLNPNFLDFKEMAKKVIAKK
jgi:hypothetical protein